MFNLASRALFAVAAFCLAAVVVYANTTSDRVGFVLLATATGVAVFLGLASLAATGPADRAALVGVQGPLEGRAPQASWMPILAALSAGGLVLGAALGVAAYVFALAGVALAGIGWFVTAWREHPNFLPSVRRRVADRFSLPFGLPLAMASLVAILMISVSRILLAVTKTWSTVIAGVIGTVILLVGAVFAARPRIDRRILGVLTVLAAVAVLGMGVVGIAQGERDFEHHGTDTEHVESGVTPSTESGAEEGAGTTEGAEVTEPTAATDTTAAS